MSINSEGPGRITLAEDDAPPARIKVLGIGGAAVTAWDIAKWPVVLVVVMAMFAILYWAAPNARQGGFRWVSPGGTVAVVVWLVTSAGFALYVANFGSYNKTYGTLATIIVFLVWLYLTNTAVLLGAELNAELERGRALEAGHPANAAHHAISAAAARIAANASCSVAGSSVAGMIALSRTVQQ